MASLAGLLANPMLEQILLYNIGGQLIGAALGPYLVALTNEVNQATPLVPLPPADLADAVIRNILDEPTAAHEAAFAGINADRFHQLTLLAGNAPDPTSLAVALRRGLIDAATYDRGIRQGRLRDEWGQLVQELATQLPTPSDALTALVEGQLDEPTARAKYAAFGGAPSEFDWLYGTIGAAPSPLEAASAAHRGLIPWTGKGLGVVSFEQAVAEGHTRNKWTDVYRRLADYLPPPRTITAMHREGVLTDAQAMALLADQGVSPELATAYLAASSKQKLVKTKELAESTVLELYRDRLIPRPEAIAFLERLGWSAQEADYILQVEDFRLEARAITAATTRLHALYTGHKLTRQDTLAALAGLGVGASEAEAVVSVWDHERAANVKHLTPAEIAAAVAVPLIDVPTALAMLEAQGYQPHDAWLYLSTHRKQALPGEPPGGSVVGL